MVYINIEAVHQRCFSKKVLYKNAANSKDKNNSSEKM